MMAREADNAYGALVVDRIMEDLDKAMPALRRRHHMPFGAELSANGAVRFRLWAPAARSVELVLYDGGTARSLPMPAHADGWYCLDDTPAHVGSRYRYRIDGELEVPDPASRFNPDGVHGASEVIDPAAYAWEDDGWRAPPWHTSVIYELHVGTFNAPGTFAAVIGRLAHLARLGVTALELMPVNAFAGTRGWGYDGVLPFAPQASYGRPEDLKDLVAAAHNHGLAVILDVVYNHFGPEGNYLHRYAPQFFNERAHTPWGAAINFDGEGSRPVRDFFVHNALYWLEEYHFDGLRLDAIHAVHDASEPHIVNEIARAARSGPGRNRTVYLTLENFDNAARFLGEEGAPWTCDAQWNDDAHHALHVLLTGETHDYYRDFASEPAAQLCRALAEGFVYQGEHSPFLNAARGEKSAHLPLSAFINFLQNHDQVGNRVHAERLTEQLKDPAALRAASALLLLAPSPPLLFMGEEWGATEPFPWFCDYEPQLMATVREHRAREFPGARDPGDPATVAAATLNWAAVRQGEHARTLLEYRRLLTIRRRDIVPLLPQLQGASCSHERRGNVLVVSWRLRDRQLHLLANLGAAAAPLPRRPSGRLIFATHPGIRALFTSKQLPPWCVLWLLEQVRER
jgi:maltooligosyltrehalose trehalohydrolase